MITLFSRLLMFLSLYLPLSTVIAALYWKSNLKIAILSLSLGIVGTIGMLLFLKLANDTSAVSITKPLIKRNNKDAMAYFVTYVVPFLVFPNETRERKIALLVFLFVIGIIYINSDLIHINPTLS